MNCPACQTPLPANAGFCLKCGHSIKGGMADSEYEPEPVGDATGGIIPYKNGPALAAYYCAVFSLIPCIGLIPGVIALVLGIKGYKQYKRTPAIRGAAHAWIGIILGGLTTLVWGGLLISFGVAMVMKK